MISSSKIFAITLALVGALGIGSACTNDFGQYNFADSGAGASSSTSTGMDCTNADDCPGQDDACSTRTCNGNKCGRATAPVGTDCPGGTCDADGNCLPLTCTNGIKDADETDVDCGGPCPPCPGGGDCNDPSDCTSNFCDKGECKPCGKNGDCDAVDGRCNNGVCVTQRKDGDPCTAPEQCESDSCVDGVCCESACSDTCEACSEALTGQADGSCAPSTSGTDPDAECDEESMESCGRSGMCDGDRKCALWPANTACSGFCAGDTFVGQVCDGNGSCNGNSMIDCAPFACQNNACVTDCMGDDNNCASGNACNGNVCMSKGQNGTACATPNECSSGNCADGFCCNFPCNADCRACSAAKNGAADGTCSFIPNGQDPDNECPGNRTCNGFGMCSF